MLSFEFCPEFKRISSGVLLNILETTDEEHKPSMVSGLPISSEVQFSDEFKGIAAM